jgi:hypothetical protein
MNSSILILASWIGVFLVLHWILVIFRRITQKQQQHQRIHSKLRELTQLFPQIPEARLRAFVQTSDHIHKPTDQLIPLLIKVGMVTEDTPVSSVPTTWQLSREERERRLRERKESLIRSAKQHQTSL